MNKLLIFTICSSIIILFSCKNKINPFFNSYIFDAEERDFLLDNDILNPNLDDNIIYTRGAVFTYSYKFFQNDTLKKCSIKSGRKMKPVLSIPSDNSEEALELDYIKLYVYNGKGDINLAKSQSIIKYDYYIGDRKFYLGERTGVLEDSASIFLHPPRNHCFISTCIHPFPYIKFPLSIGATWEAHFGIPSYAYEDQFLKEKMKKFPESLDMNYEVERMQVLNTKMGKIECFVINGFGSNDNKTITELKMFFNEQYGFVKLDYYNHLDITKLVLDLEEVKK